MRRRLLTAAAVAALGAAACRVPDALAQQQQRPPQQQQQAPSLLWFDPTQLPAFTGTVERYLPNPRGETDRLLFREGPQVVFPPDMAEGLRQASPPGRPVTVWGIRARNAPVITLLAYSPNPAEAAPTMVDRLYWRLGGRNAAEQAETIAVAGTVKAPYYTPQGEVAGAILEDGTVIVLPQGSAEPFRDLLRPGSRVAAEGAGHAGEGGKALVAARLGDTPQALRAVEPAASAGGGGAAPAQPGGEAAPPQGAGGGGATGR
jgi:hypothetical protein